jgi:O-acetylhomoserine (thiol)-lyase
MTEKPYRFATQVLHAGQEPDPATGSRAVPIYSTVAYNFTDSDQAAKRFALKEFGQIYSRITNPTCEVLEKRLAALDGGKAALSFASGMAAINAALLTITRSGQNFLSATSLYGGTWTAFTQTFKKLGIEVRFFDPDDIAAAADLIDEQTRCIYLESIGNPKGDIPDFESIAALAHKFGLPLIVDNTVTTPALFRPLEYGADIVVYSATKYIGGHGLHVGGAVVDGGSFDWTREPDRWPEFTRPDPAYHGLVFSRDLEGAAAIAYSVHMRTHWLRDTGACMSPFAAWLFLVGLETLALRMPRHVENAKVIAAWLSAHPKVSWVSYPGLPGHPCYERGRTYMPAGAGAIIGFELAGGKEQGVRFIERLALASHLANIGDAKTLVVHPASTTHQQLNEAEQAATGVTPGFIRLCVGIEDVRDIQADLQQALEA